MDDFKGLIRSQEKISFLFNFCYGMFEFLLNDLKALFLKNDLFFWKSTKGGFCNTKCNDIDKIAIGSDETMKLRYFFI